MPLQYGVSGEDSTVPWVSADGCPLGQVDSYLSRNYAGEQKTLTPALSHPMGEGEVIPALEKRSPSRETF